MPKVNVPPVRPSRSAIRPPLASLPLLRNPQNKTPAQPTSIPSTTPPQAIALPPPTPKALQAKAAPDTSSKKPESDPGVNAARTKAEEGTPAPSMVHVGCRPGRAPFFGSLLIERG